MTKSDFSKPIFFNFDNKPVSDSAQFVRRLVLFKISMALGAGHDIDKLAMTFGWSVAEITYEANQHREACQNPGYLRSFNEGCARFQSIR